MSFSVGYSELAWHKALAELKAESSRYFIGILWWLLEPAIYVATLYVVFSAGLRMGGENFLEFLLCGLVLWKWFSSTVQTASNVFVGNKNLMYQVYFDKSLLITVVLIANTLKFLILLTMLLVLLMALGHMPTMTWFAISMVLVNTFLVIASCSAFAAIVIPFFPEFRLILDNGMMVLFFMSGIFFDISERTEPIRSILLMNPVAGLIRDLRLILLDNQLPDLTYTLSIFFFSSLACVVAFLLLRRLDYKIVKAVS